MGVQRGHPLPRGAGHLPALRYASNASIYLSKLSAVLSSYASIYYVRGGDVRSIQSVGCTIIIRIYSYPRRACHHPALPDYVVTLWIHRVPIIPPIHPSTHRHTHPHPPSITPLIHPSIDVHIQKNKKKYRGRRRRRDPRHHPGLLRGPLLPGRAGLRPVRPRPLPEVQGTFYEWFWLV